MTPLTPAGSGDAAEAERQLVALARAGDERAFEQLVRRHQDRAYLVALRMLGSRADAEDAVQEAFLQAWRGLPTFRGEAAFSTWLTSIVINRVRNARRRGPAPSRPLPEDDAPQGPRARVEPGADEVVVGNEKRDAVVAAVLALPDDQQAAFVLHVLDGRPHAEVGRILGITDAASKVRVHRARRRVLQTLAGWGEDDDE